MSYVITLAGYTPSPRYDGNPWTQAQLAYSAGQQGPFTTFDTLNLSPVDTDPTAPAVRNFTSSLSPAPTGWFQVTFLDAAGDEEPTDPVSLGVGEPFASVARFANRLGITMSSEEQTRAADILQLVTGVIQEEARQTIALVTDDVLTRPGTTDDRIRLPERPVGGVSLVVLNGVTLLPVTDWVLSADMLVRVSPASIVASSFTTGALGWGDPTQTLQVTYTHGFATIPLAIEAVCLEVAARVWVNPGSVVRERYGPEETDYALRGIGGVTGLMLAEDERRMVWWALRQLAGSTPLR